MFGLFAPPPIVEIVEADHDRLTLRSPKKFRIGKQSRVRLRLPGGKLLAARILCIWNRPWVGGGFTVGCRLVEPNRVPQEAPSPKHTGRDGQRVDGRFRVVSRQLPEFSAMSLDLSESGLLLLTRGPLPAGCQLELRLEPEMSNWEDVTFWAEVIWCKEDGKRFRVGLQYVNLDPSTRERLDQLQHFLTASKDAHISTRLLGGADGLLKDS